MVPTLAPDTGPVNHLDDDADQNLIPSTKVFVFGARTADFTLALGTAPVAADGETGVQSAGDDLYDANSNLTIDLGLFTLPPASAPLAGTVSRVLGADTEGTAANESPLPDVEVTLYLDANGDGSLAPSEMNAAGITTTSSDGAYEFDRVAPGDYFVIQTVLPGAQAVSDTDGGDPFCTSISMEGRSVDGIDFTQALTPDSYAEWLADHPDGADDDGDAYSSLVEYALGTSPDRADAPAFWLEINPVNGIPAALLRRSTAGHRDIAYRLEGSHDLRTWSRLALAAAVTPHSDGTETVRYSGLTSPFVRLAIVLDADLNGQAEQTALTPVLGWTQRQFAAASQTFSMPLLRDAVYVGTASSATAAVLPAGCACYAEVISGADEGRRFEITSTSGDTGALTYSGGIAPAPSARIAIRPHWSLAELLPVTAFRASASQESADRVLFYDNGAYRIVWLYAAPQGPRWVRRGDATLADAGSTILPPDEGILVHPRSTPVTLPLRGEVRTWAFISKLHAGSQLVASGHPLPQTPVQRLMNVLSGFTASADESTADRILFWDGDTQPGASSFTPLHLRLGATSAVWSDSSARAASSALFQPYGAAMIHARRDIPLWKQPRP